ncbi:MAG: hypothetical protein ACRDPH_13670 [Marmoricola sp.]
MRRPHENVATVLVDPRMLGDLELELMAHDLRVWPVRTAPNCVDGPRTAFQIRRRFVLGHEDDRTVVAGWTPVWVGFGSSWRDGDEPLPWRAHRALWHVLDRYAEHVRFRRRLGGVRPLSVPSGLEDAS